MASLKLPKRTSNQKLGDVGEIECARQFIRWGWTSDRINSDFGEDLDCNIFIDGQRSNLQFRCQVKSTSTGRGTVRLLKNGDYSVQIETSVLRMWFQSFYPILLLVYDSNLEKIFWHDVSSEIVGFQGDLSKKSATIRVSRFNELSLAKSEVSQAVVAFYSRFFRISDVKIRCSVIPVLMPGYHGCGMWHWLDWLGQNDWGELTVKLGRIDLEYFPAWVSAINLLEPFAGILALHVTSSTNDPAEFINVLQAKLPRSLPSKESAQWITYVISPLELAGNPEDLQLKDQFWKSEITSWKSFTILNDIIVDEQEFVFEKPRSFLAPIGKASGFSWGLYPLVSKNYDLAMRIFATIPASQDHRARRKARQNIYHSQYLPWICDEQDLELLKSMLHDLNLGFIQLLDLSTDTKIVGVICTDGFDPEMIFFSTPHYWSERTGGVRHFLKDQETKIPGKLGDSSIRRYLEETAAPHVFGEEDYDYVITESEEYISGLPTDLTKRIIEVTRYRVYDDNFDPNQAMKLLEELAQNIEQSPSVCSPVNYDAVVYDPSPYPLIRIEINWHPTYFQSSSKSFEEIATLIEKTFDLILPRLHKDNEMETYDIFHIYGRVVFEDQPDYFKQYFGMGSKTNSGVNP